MKKLILLAFFISINVFAFAQEKEVLSMKAHIEQGLNCIDCHGSDKPERNANQSFCIDCHANSNDTYIGQIDKDGNSITKTIPDASGKTFEVVVHKSHAGVLRCTLCHTYHKVANDIFCNTCHALELKVK